MITFKFSGEYKTDYKVLCLGAHSDDIEIGCGGTILRLKDEFPNLSVYWVVFGSDQTRTKEAVNSATVLLNGVEDKKIIVKEFKDGFYPYIGSEIKEYFEELKGVFSPDLIFTHYRDDLHQDHRLINELTWNTYRNHFILEYEIPKYDGDLGSPNMFVHLSKSVCQAKAQHLMANFKSQTDRFWFTEDTFMAILRLRGVESRSPLGYAEGFFCRKLAI